MKSLMGAPVDVDTRGGAERLRQRIRPCTASFVPHHFATMLTAAPPSGTAKKLLFWAWSPETAFRVHEPTVTLSWRVA